MASGAASSGYHGHIDGLRAVAIALVLLYHFQLGGAAQGFLGVDVFFIISGFLVGGIVQSALATDSFSLIDFYRRRIARIAPALFAAAALFLAAGWLVLLPDDFARFARAARAASLNIANWHFSTQPDYFAPARTDRFFLHSWSLSVEVQFYVALPLAAWLIHRFGRWWRTGIGLLLLASVAAYWLVGIEQPRAAFYFASLRAWEFLAGVLIAAMPLRPIGRSAAIAMASAGALLVVVPAFTALQGNFIANSLWQLACVFGTVLLLVVNVGAPQNPVARLLALPWMRALGLISYSLYLVHWPLLTFARNWHIEPLPPAMRLVLLLASIGLAALSWYAVERPVRRWANRPQTPAPLVYGVSLLACVLLVAAASAIVISKGFPARLSEREQALLSAGDARLRCPAGFAALPRMRPQPCHLGDRTSRPDVAIWGDSHSHELAHALGERLAPANRSILQYTSSGCPPFVGVDFASRPTCRPTNDRILQQLNAMSSVRTVVITAYFERHAALGQRAMAESLTRTVRSLRGAGKRVIIVGSLPEPHYSVASGLARRLWHDRIGVATALPEAEFRRRSKATRAILGTLAAREGVAVIDTGRALCFDRTCPYLLDGVLLYSDGHHSTLVGARRIARLMAPLLPPPGAVTPH